MKLFNPYLSKLDKLQKFRDLYYQYSNPPIEHRDSELRKQLNISLPEVKRYVHESGTPYLVDYRPSPLIGGFSGPLDIFDNIFKLHEFQLETSHIYDIIDRSIGVYQLKSKLHYKKIINPLYWIGEIIRIPFVIFNFAGFNGIKIEGSWFGKIYKLGAGLASLLATAWVLIQLLKFFGFDLATYIHF